MPSEYEALFGEAVEDRDDLDAVHSLFVLGGLAFAPFRRTGLLYQAAGALALWPRLDPLTLLAAATAAGNAYLALAVWRARRAA